MRLSLRAKLIAIVGIAAFAFMLLIGAGALIGRETDRELTTIERRLLPKVELAPRLDAQFEKLRRSFQDAVAAFDAEALARTSEQKDALLEQLAAARQTLDPVQVDGLSHSISDYYATAMDVSRRLLAGETGEGLVGAMSEMQAKHTRAVDALRITTTFDRNELSRAFAAAAHAQATAGRVRLVVSAVCLVFVLALSLWFSRGVLKSVNALTAGLRRFGRGDFGNPIVGVGTDELGEVATQANQMAASLSALAEQRDRMDWLKNGQAGLSDQLRGELDLEDVAARSIRCLATYVGAPVAALYDRDAGRGLRLIGQFARAAEPGPPADPEPTARSAGQGQGQRPGEGQSDAGQAAARFADGEGLVGQAALQSDIMIIDNPPSGYLRVRSGLGEANVRAVVFVPIIHAHASRVTGVMEFGLFGPWSERHRELVLAVRETISIAMEVARARTATRKLLAETQRQADLLSQQEEALRASNEELQSQQEELRQTNEELIQQTAELEMQRKTLQDRNVDLVQARSDLERKAAELSTVSAYKSQFLANMSHELRTPLNSMLLLSNLLASNDAGTLTAKQVEYARTIYAAGRDLLALINQVLDLAKIEAGRYDIHVAPLLLREVVGGLERVFMPLAQDKGLRLITEVGANVPDTIVSDRQRIEQVLNNLLANAIKFTEKGEVSLRIGRPDPNIAFRREDLRPDQVVAFVVSDSGVGIAPRDHDRIFAPFEQVDAAPDRRYGGTGLGLNIAREMTQLLGGELQLRSNLGEGSTFTCFLPLAVQGRPHPGQPATMTKTTTQATAPAGNSPAGAQDSNQDGKQDSKQKGKQEGKQDGTQEGTLLIIEDDARFAAALGEVIERQGLQFRIASDGRTGLRMARDRHRRPQAIVLDVMLPDIDGWTVMEELRSDPTTATIPVHFISGVDAADHGRALGAVGYLTKPASQQELVRVVQSLAPHPGRRKCRVLVVEAPESSDSLAAKLGAEGLHLQPAGSAPVALQLLGQEPFDCMILDLSLPDMDGLQFLREVRAQCGAATPAVVVYAGRPLSKVEAQVLEAHSEAVVLNEGSSTERLLDEVRLFARRVNEGVDPRRRVPPRLHPADVRLQGRKVLVADDDMRTLYALSAMLRAKGMEVLAADTGQVALTLLDENPDVEAVLMDIMMPEMDGYEAMRRIRADARFKALPIIAVTAKAMKGDADKCLQAGANDYLPKPLDPDRMVAMLLETFGAARASTKDTAAAGGEWQSEGGKEGDRGREGERGGPGS